MKNYVGKVCGTFWIIVLFAICCSCTQTRSLPEKKYLRSDWEHWTDKDKDCQNTRQEILIERSLVKVSLNKKGCKVVQGKWMDYYHPEEHIHAKNIDIDHLIPLKHAHDSGAFQWSKDEKKQFANDPDNLVITNRSYNRMKGAKTIAEWLPVNKERACRYIKDWVRIKKKYNLTLQESEKNTIQLSGCIK